MENGIFRKKSMDKISSPEQFNQYLCVVNTCVACISGCVSSPFRCLCLGIFRGA